jgi:hypothetical protein
MHASIPASAVLASLIISVGAASQAAPMGSLEMASPHATTADAPVDRSGQSHGPSLHLALVDDADASSASLDAAAREVSTIWAAVGLRVAWVRRDVVDGASAARIQLSIVIRRTLVPSRTLTPAAEHRTPLGWVSFDADGRPANQLEISLAAVMASVASASYAGVGVPMLPRSARQALVGRALGRVIAHELGHWLFGRAHAGHGLMRQGLSGHELTKRVPPALPRTWVHDVPERLAARLSSCEPAQARIADIVAGR